jgi:hypothetical protein
MLELTIVADTNDADYVREVSVVTQEQVDRFMPLIKAIINKPRSHNWENGEYAHGPPPREVYKEFDQGLIDEFEEFLPYGEYGIHTINQILLRKIVVLKQNDFLK